MSKFLQRLYKEVLDKFPFSISGYHDSNKEYENFFRSICKFQESLEEDNKIHFTISGFAELDVSSGLSDAELDLWATKPLKNLLFNDNYLGFSEPILSLYVFLLEQLTCSKKKVVNILADNVNNSILIKILLNQNLEEIQFSFIKSDNTLLIEVPLLYFKNIKEDKKLPLHNLFGKLDYEKDLIVTREGISSAYCISIDESKRSKFKSIANETVNLKSIKTIAKSRPENVYDELLKKVFKNDGYEPEEINALIFASSLLCYFYDCSLTYFVSTARVANNKRYTLGAMGIGLKSGNELSDHDKALYLILVNHLASNLATQIVRDNNKYLRYSLMLRQQYELLSDFNEKVMGQKPDGLNHCSVKIEEKHVTECQTFFQNKKSDFDEAGLQYFYEYVLNTFIEGEFTDRGLFTSIHLPKNAEVKAKNILYTNAKSVGIKIDGNEEPIINVVLLHKLISTIKERTKLKNFSVEFLGEKDFLEVTFEFENSVSVGKFKRSLDGTRTNGPGDVGQFFIDYYEQFMIAGNICILDETEKVIVDFDKDIYPIYKDGIPIALNTDRISDSDEYKKLIYKIWFRSIKS
jgi:hypothetical protein